MKERTVMSKVTGTFLFSATPFTFTDSFIKDVLWDLFSTNGTLQLVSFFKVLKFQFLDTLANLKNGP